MGSMLLNVWDVTFCQMWRALRPGKSVGYLVFLSVEVCTEHSTRDDGRFATNSLLSGWNSILKIFLPDSLWDLIEAPPGQVCGFNSFVSANNFMDTPPVVTNTPWNYSVLCLRVLVVLWHRRTLRQTWRTLRQMLGSAVLIHLEIQNLC